MELLLALLSLLTAATGAVAGARAPEAGVHQSAGITAIAPARQATTRIAVAPIEKRAAAVDRAMPAVALETPTAAPLYADRRRE